MIYLLIYLKFLIRFGYIQVILGIDLKELLVVLGAFLKIGDASWFTRSLPSSTTHATWCLNPQLLVHCKS